ncbi:hypothetical protein OXPF_06310 [Oxobacter pfennigii]|uniref:Uncharacterized protein n=1 Tax=Oxobacter pfennigii TaxID=36849 RepID=A0A0P8X3M8_9CLOT|nr:hypothetical protein [Oxobacter pfennigii]KPU45398.1 hypothetical protein OXPF_06310 [Oxobacter pfennigii]
MSTSTVYISDFGTNKNAVNNKNGIFGTPTSTALFTILILVIIILACGGQVFGGYSNYPGYGGFSPYGYTYPPWRRCYRYNPYDMYDD